MSSPTMTALDRLLARPAARDVVTFAYDPHQAAELTEARARLLLAGVDEQEALASEVAALEADMVTMSFHLTAIGGDDARNILDDHLSKDRQQYLPTLGPALLKRMCTRVEVTGTTPIDGLSDKHAADVFARLSVEDQDRLIAACLGLNRRSTVIEAGP